MDNKFNPKEMQDIKRILDKIAQNKNPFETSYYKDYINSLYKSKNKKPPFKAKGYLGAALAVPTFYSILNNPAYSMQEKAENMLIEGTNYVPIYGDLKQYIDIDNIKPIRYNTNTIPTRGVGFYEREP